MTWSEALESVYGISPDTAVQIITSFAVLVLALRVEFGMSLLRRRNTELRRELYKAHLQHIGRERQGSAS